MRQNTMGFFVTALFLGGLLLPDAISMQEKTSTVHEGNVSTKVFKRKIVGNYELNAKVQSNGKDQVLRIFFSADENLSHFAYMDIMKNRFTVGRKTGDTTAVWKEYDGVTGPPWQIRILKKGNFFRFWVNDVTGWIRGPLGEWEGVYEPWQAYVGLEVGGDAVVSSLTVTTLPWLSQLTTPLIPNGPKGSFYEAQVIPGAIVQLGGKYYMYFMAGMYGNQEGSSRRSIGVAISTDLRTWTVHPEPVITYKDYPYDNLYVNGAVVTPENKIAVMFSAQVYPEWKGFMLATSDAPFGPFTPYAKNPVYKHFTHAHEFDLVRVDQPEYRYILFYAGFTPKPPSGPVGDRGYLLFSDDLIHWKAHVDNPVFSPQTLNDWDAVHIRPRSLNKIGDTWYLWYEGCNEWTPPHLDHDGWWDTVGLARSKDLLHWEYYPRNPALPGLGASPKQFDKDWVGWPRMVVQNDTGYVFYVGGWQTGMRTIAIGQLTDWTSEGGETIDMQK